MESRTTKTTTTTTTTKRRRRYFNGHVMNVKRGAFEMNMRKTMAMAAMAAMMAVAGCDGGGDGDAAATPRINVGDETASELVDDTRNLLDTTCKSSLGLTSQYVTKTGWNRIVYMTVLVENDVCDPQDPVFVGKWEKAVQQCDVCANDMSFDDAIAIIAAE